MLFAVFYLLLRRLVGLAGGSAEDPARLGGRVEGERRSSWR